MKPTQYCMLIVFLSITFSLLAFSLEGFERAYGASSFEEFPREKRSAFVPRGSSRWQVSIPGKDSGWEGDHVVFLYKGFVEEGGVAIIEKSCFSMGSSSSCQYLRCYVIILPNAKVVLQYAIVRQKHLEQSFCCTSN